MVHPRFMSKARWLVLASLTLGLGAGSISACSSGDDRPASLVSLGGQSAGGAAGHNGTSPGDAGQANGEAGNPDADDGGAAGESNLPAAPLAIFPQQLQVDVGCGAAPEPTQLVIRNDGLLPLTISSATASAGYVVKSELPLQIAARESGMLLVVPPAPKAAAPVGGTSSGTLTFVTNEDDSPPREVLLNTTLYGGLLEFTDADGIAVSGALPLTYLSSETCPDRVTYRVHNTGNLTFTLFGPTFPSHLGGTSTSVSGQSVVPNGYAEFEVGGNSANDGACSASGELTFTVQGSFCGTVPKLAVTWPTNSQTGGCTCSIAAQ